MRRQKRVWSCGILAGVALLGACAPSVQLPEPEIALPDRFESTPHQAAAQAPGERWWTLFADAQLADLIDTALARSTTARVAHARIMEARAVRGLDRAGTLPTGSVTGSAAEQGGFALGGGAATPVPSRVVQGAFAPAWEVDLFGRLAEVRARADLDFAAARLDFYGARLALAADVATSLFSARLAAADLATAREQERIARDLAGRGGLADRRGLIAAQDLARLDAELAAAEAQVPRREAVLRRAKLSLLILAGRPETPTDALGIEPDLAVPPPVAASTPGRLLERRPDVQRAHMALLSAASTVEIDRLALFPRLTLTPSVSLSDGAGSPGGLWSLAGGVSVPILDRARLMAQLHVSEARGARAVAEYERAVQAAFGEAANALALLAADERRLPRLETAEARSRAAFEAARRGYAAGLTDLTTLLQAESAWRQSRALRDAGRAGRLIGTVDTIRALGGGWDPSSTELPAPAPRRAMGGR
jgi:NodT family efflux transporter outer membrane factor (OMF) lipoprotein